MSIVLSCIIIPQFFIFISIIILSLQTVLEVCYLIPETNVGTLVVSIVAIIGLILAKELNAYLSKKLPVPIPVELLGVSIKIYVYPLRIYSMDSFTRINTQVH